MTKPDPKVRRDGRCALRKCRKPLTIPERTYATRVQHLADPFCSVVCCREYHGVTITPPAPGGRRKMQP